MSHQKCPKTSSKHVNIAQICGRGSFFSSPASRPTRRSCHHQPYRRSHRQPRRQPHRQPKPLRPRAPAAKNKSPPLLALRYAPVLDGHACGLKMGTAITSYSSTNQQRTSGHKVKHPERYVQGDNGVERDCVMLLSHNDVEVAVPWCPGWRRRRGRTS